MGTNARNTVGLKLIQLSSSSYAIEHQCVLSELKTLKIGERICVIYSNNADPFVFPARVMELWQEGDVLFLKLWNYRKDKWEIYTQDLTIEDCLFQFVSVPFISKMSEIMVDKGVLESRALDKPSRQGQSLIANDNKIDKPELPQPFYNSSGEKILEYITPTEIRLSMPIILTQNKRLKLNMPYLKTESSLSGNKVVAVRLLDFKVKEEIIQLSVQELENKRIYTLEWNMDYIGSYWMWSISDLSTHLKRTGTNNVRK